MTIKTSARAKHLRLTILPGGEVVATLPRGVPRELLDRFVARKASWIARAVGRMKKIAPKIKLPRGHYQANRKAAEEFIRRRVRELNQAYGFSYRSITIRNQKTRWGSCSRKGGLSFNYRVFLLPPELADYVMTHELCHLQEFNHSRKFWQLMQQTLPNARALRRALARHHLRIG